MDPYQSGQVDMFVNITGASVADARAKLQAFRGDLNAAIDSYLSEKENSIPPVQTEEAGVPVWIDEDEPPRSQRISPPTAYPLPSGLTYASTLPRVGGAMAPLFPLRRRPPFVSQPRDVREIPINWIDGNSRVGSSAGLLIEEIPATVEETVPSQRPAHFVTEADEDSPSVARGFRGRSDDSPWATGIGNMGGNFQSRRTNLDAPLMNEVTTMARNEGDDLDEDILRAVIEASQKETTRSVGDHGGAGAEDDDFALAVTLSLKTAEQEKALREEKEASGWFSESGNDPNIDKRENLNITKRRGVSSTKGNFSEHLERMKSVMQLDTQDSNASANNMSSLSRENQPEDEHELNEQPLVRRRSGRHQNQTGTSAAMPGRATIPRKRQEQRDGGGIHERPSDQHENGTVKDEWGGLSLEEQEEAKMLEAAMFGSSSENAAFRFGHPPLTGGLNDTDGVPSDIRGSRGVTRQAQQPPSPAVVAERLLRAKQDDEYRASLVADREKEEKAQSENKSHRLKEAEAKSVARVEETLRQEEKSQKLEEILKQVDAQRAALPEEPSVDDESAVTLMVRMPDGTRQGRRFRISEPLRCLFNFIDVSCGPLPGRYQLVRPYPREAFTDAECESSFHKLGLISKYETLFLEFV